MVCVWRERDRIVPDQMSCLVSTGRSHNTERERETLNERGAGQAEQDPWAQGGQEGEAEAMWARVWVE